VRERGRAVLEAAVVLSGWFRSVVEVARRRKSPPPAWLEWNAPLDRD
jgi:hypothetical protein